MQQGEGFSLYVFDKFAFDAAKGRLSLSSHPEYYVDIEKLPANYDLAQLAAAGKKELASFGEVSDHSGELVEHPLGFAELYLQSSGVKGFTIISCGSQKQATPSGFDFGIPKARRLPISRARVLVSLSTVQSDSR
ncbi:MULTISPECIES: hypothetical protein [unclassified Paenibacillus]|uniref:hypothetical protein n=1 Tax=unclassified Paenibacillus TaxID=185978 RepID=UPI001A060880|nr:hypothetical protein [Paenibacillus sp. Y412MC10]